MENRNLIAISIKHTINDCPAGKRWKFGMPFTLWGHRRTADNESRSFSGYTYYLNEAELYSLQDWVGKYNAPWMKTDEPVKMSVDICKKYKQFDTVLVAIEDVEAYFRICGLYTDRPKEAYIF